MVDADSNNNIAKDEVFFESRTIIAEQKRGGNQSDRVEWTTADPLSGSSIVIPQSGEADLPARTELEPLGQEVLPEEPLEDDPPITGNRPPTSVDDPEWICSIYPMNDKTLRIFN